MNTSEPKLKLSIEQKVDKLLARFLDEPDKTSRAGLQQMDKMDKVADERKFERIERKETIIETKDDSMNHAKSPTKEELPLDKFGHVDWIKIIKLRNEKKRCTNMESKEEIKNKTTGSESDSNSLPRYAAPFKYRYALTLGEQSEIRPGTIRIGNGFASRGFTVDDLTEFKERLGERARLVMLHDFLEIESERNKWSNQAALLIIKDGINLLMNEEHYATKMYQEQQKVRYDRKYFDTIYRQDTVDSKARYNIMLADEGCQHSEDYKQPTVIAYDSVPLFKGFRNKLPDFFGERARNLNCEGNQYFEAKSGINFHGDAERKKVLCASLGRTMTLAFVWRVPGGKKLCSKAMKFRLEHGDIYIMSEKTTGFDWQHSGKYHLVHAAGETQIDIKKAAKTLKFGNE
jgi:hypothetical protein